MENNPMQAIDFVFSLAVLVVSVMIHEVAHGYAALSLGDRTAERAGRLTLNPLAHIDIFGSVLLPLLLAVVGAPVFGWAKPVPYNPYNLRGGKWGPGLVALAGPASNFILAAVFSIILRTAYPMGLLSDSFLALGIQIIIVNVALGLFNLVPIPPIDGSKVLFSILPYRWIGIQRFLETNQYLLIFLLIFFVWDKLIPIVYSVLMMFLGPLSQVVL